MYHTDVCKTTTGCVHTLLLPEEGVNITLVLLIMSTHAHLIKQYMYQTEECKITTRLIIIILYVHVQMYSHVLYKLSRE